MRTEPGEHPSHDSEDDSDEETTRRPAKVEISGIEGTFDGEIGWVTHRGTYEAVRFTAKVANEIATAFGIQSDEQLDNLDEEDTGSDLWNSDKCGHLRPRPHFSPGEFQVVTGDGEWESINPDEDGVFQIEFDGFYWAEVGQASSQERHNRRK